MAIIFGVTALASLALNFLLIYYIKLSINKFSGISFGILNLKQSIEDFSAHLKYVYELEMYYGDETLKGLIDHAKTLRESFDQEYEEFYDLFEIQYDETEEPEEEEDAA
tara:strand:+ start:375 stop:701 length:327 start_codon:yes stop_codon:yes gene_type:complete